MKIPIHRVDSVAGEVDAMQKRIATRAEQLYEGREGGLPLHDWLAATTGLGLGAAIASRNATGIHPDR